MMPDAQYCFEAFCADAGSWADWFAGAASCAAVIVALLGYYLVEIQRRRDSREADIRTAQLIGMKVLRMINSSHDIHKHLWASYEGPRLGFDGKEEVWRAINPLVGLSVDNSLDLEGIEMGLLIRINEPAYLSDLILAISRLQSITRSMEEYRLLRQEYHRMIPPPVEMDGLVGTHELTREQYLQLQPISESLEHLVRGLRGMTQENTEIGGRLAAEFHPMMKRHFPKAKFIVLEAAGDGPKEMADRVAA